MRNDALTLPTTSATPCGPPRAIWPNAMADAEG